MGFVKNIKNHFYNQKINKRIKQCKYVHIMFNDKFNKPFVDFLNRNFSSKEHLVLCKRWFKEYPFPVGENVIEIQTLHGLNFENCEKVICHSLFDGELVNYLYKHKDILENKSYWVVWGGDLYNVPKDEKNDFVRANFKGYLLFAYKDKDVLLKNYRNVQNKNFYPIEYPLNLDISRVNITKNNYTKIQINNSADKTTLEMLDTLSKFKDENIRITTILSYGQMNYKEQIIQKGNYIFGKKFEYIENFLSPEDYAKHIASLDIFIANQNRQQATANIDMCLYFGKKVFIKSDVSTYEMYTSLGYQIFDTYDIKDLNFEEFKLSQSNDNKKLAKYYISDAYRKKLWRNTLNDK